MKELNYQPILRDESKKLKLLAVLPLDASMKNVLLGNETTGIDEYQEQLSAKEGCPVEAKIILALKIPRVHEAIAGRGDLQYELSRGNWKMSSKWDIDYVLAVDDKRVLEVYQAYYWDERPYWTEDGKTINRLLFTGAPAPYDDLLSDLKGKIITISDGKNPVNYLCLFFCQKDDPKTKCLDQE